MLRSTLLALVGSLAFVASASAQKWAADMFPVKNHEFGSVARGSKAEYAFEFQNLYKEDVHVASVRASCGCTTPSITKNTIKSWEKSSIVAKFNTATFLGQRGATVTVVIDKPFYAEVQLQVRGFIRDDVMFEPGVINLGQVDQGNPGEAKVRVNYRGRENWNIVDVQSANTNFEVELSDASRGGGQVNYTMTVRLKPQAPVGFINDQLTIVTDDGRNQTIPLNVEGRVQPAIELSPNSILLNTLEPGETVSRQLVVKSKKKIKLQSVTSDLPGFAFKMPATDEPKALHIIPLTFVAHENPGAFSAKIRIETDAGITAECLATGIVKAPAAVTEGAITPAQTTTAKLPR